MPGRYFWLYLCNCREFPFQRTSKALSPNREIDMIENYTDETIRTLDWKEHIRKRPGMYIGKLGDGSLPDDGIYILLKEVLDNSVDEYMMGFGKTIEVSINEHRVTIRDFGRGVPLGKVVDVASKMNTGAKYDSKVFKKRWDLMALESRL